MRGWLIITVALLLLGNVSAQDKINFRDQVLESASPGWNKLHQAFERDGAWRVQWSDGVDVDVTISRLDGKLIVTDVRSLNPNKIVAAVRPKRQANRGAEIIKLIQQDFGWSTFEKAENDTTWKKRADEPAGAIKPAQRLFQNSLWSTAPFAIMGVPLSDIFADADTNVTRFAPVDTQPGIYLIEFSMTHGLESKIPGVSLMKGSAPFVYYPAKCQPYVDSNQDWRVIRLEFEREGTNQGLIYDQINIQYESGTQFVVTSGQGKSAVEAAIEKLTYSVSFDQRPPTSIEYDITHYPVAESTK
ncbi:MAG: hypothetical protein JNL67_22885 [Planctomycetaceae bacterium]|nr:hypothetical protein [Planctomycetaceae bacterium]